jgi:hypothetical protein
MTHPCTKSNLSISARRAAQSGKYQPSGGGGRRIRLNSPPIPVFYYSTGMEVLAPVLLSLGDKVVNRVFSSTRVVVEHAISGVKRCRSVKDVLRLTKASISDGVMEIACGLHNLRVSWRKQFQALDLVSFFSPA